MKKEQKEFVMKKHQEEYNAFKALEDKAVCPYCNEQKNPQCGCVDLYKYDSNKTKEQIKQQKLIENADYILKYGD